MYSCEVCQQQIEEANEKIVADLILKKYGYLIEKNKHMSEDLKKILSDMLTYTEEYENKKKYPARINMHNSCLETKTKHYVFHDCMIHDIVQEGCEPCIDELARNLYKQIQAEIKDVDDLVVDSFMECFR